MKYLLKFIFPFLRSGIEAKRGVEFCHLTRNASRIRQKVGNGVSFTRFPLSTLLYAGYSVKLIFVRYVYTSNCQWLASYDLFRRNFVKFSV